MRRDEYSEWLKKCRRMRMNYNLRICPVCDTEYHPNPVFVGWKKRYCSDGCCEKAREMKGKERG